MSEVFLYDLILESAEKGLKRQAEDGSMPAGHNGPYNHDETPVRNTSHWLQTFVWCYEQTNDDRFYTATRNAVDYLLKPECRPGDATFYHRRDSSKNNCNSLIGQAWTIEALCRASDILPDQEILEVSSKVFFLHPFDHQFSLWRMVEIDGTQLPYCRTFNQQLWFAAVAGMLGERGIDEADHRATKFLSSLTNIITTNSDGQIEHLLYPKIPLQKWLNILAFRYRWHIPLNYLLRSVRKSETKEHIRAQSVGYHSFNLYALGVLREIYPNHEVWSEPIIRSTIEYTMDHTYKQHLKQNMFSFRYNPTGFEVAYAHQIFSDLVSQDCNWWINKQISQCYDYDIGLLSQGVDSETLSARMYQATRLDDYNIQSND